MKKIDEMHRMFGIGAGICGDCSNLMHYINRDRSYYKCRVYGVSSSEATDWRKKYVSCGMLNRQYSGNPIYKIRSTQKPDEQIDGQLSFFEEGDRQ